jgi:hypothetical protein
LSPAVDDAVFDILSSGDIEVLGLLPYSSNYTFLTKVSGKGSETLAVYKPSRGERPLWDFPLGTLARREVAAFLVDRAAGWSYVPPTVLRDDAPLGSGSLQLFIEHDPERHFFVVGRERLQEFAPICALDVVINNADRKAGHVIEDGDKKLWAVDHGLSFNVEPKLRTVIWAFAQDAIGSDIEAKLRRLEEKLSDPSGLGGKLESLLSVDEARATLDRVRALRTEGRFPAPEPEQHHLPWPLV